MRIAAPVVAGIGLAATFGAGVTAQLGAMRINEEIDALESMAIRPVEYLVSTRIVAGMIAITPLYSIAVILSFLASQFTTVVLFGQSGGLYDHYFDTFLNPIDLLWSFLQAVLMAIAILLVHTYLRLLRHRRALGCRRRGGQRGAYFSDRRGLGDACWCRWPSTAPTATSTCRDRGDELSNDRGSTSHAHWPGSALVVALRASSSDCRSACSAATSPKPFR